jgi:membrane-bound lytic murein transglycosylase D
MIKLLLLTAYSLTSSFSVFTADASGISTKTFFTKDSSIKEEIIVNPRDGFKNLFESSGSANSNFEVKLNPMAVSFVEDYMGGHSQSLTKMKSWGKPYFDMMDEVLAKHGLPTELKYLSVIESQLKSTATSWAGAVGPWQFMPETARLLGLKVGKGKDERTDYVKSTQAAARYLTELYGIFNDWLLVIAAYNCGPGNVLSAIKRSGTNNFWELQRYLPTESRNHVKKFIATHYIMEGQGGLTTLTKKETDNYMITTSATVPVENNLNMEVVSVSGKYNSTVIAQILQMNISEFNRLNPGLDKQLALGNSYNLRLPSDKALLFQAQKPQILEQSIRLALTMASTRP